MASHEGLQHPVGAQAASGERAPQRQTSARLFFVGHRDLLEDRDGAGGVLVLDLHVHVIELERRARDTIMLLERQRALIPLVVEEGGEDMVGGKTTAHAYLFIRLAEGLGISRDTLFATDYLPTTIIEKNELFLLQRSSTVEALCGGNLATESINPIHMGRTAEALEKHYGVPRAALDRKSVV